MVEKRKDSREGREGREVSAQPTVAGPFSLVVKSVTRYEHTDQIHMEGEGTHAKLTLDLNDASAIYIGQPVNVTLETPAPPPEQIDEDPPVTRGKDR